MLDNMDTAVAMEDFLDLEQALNSISTALKRLEMFDSLIRDENGHLTEFGKAAIQVGRDRGIRKAELARLLKVDPTAIQYHTMNRDD